MSEKKYTSVNHENAAGRVDFKSGKAVWEWDQETNDSTSILIKSLDNPDLELEITRRTPIARSPDKTGAGKASSASSKRHDEGADWTLPDDGNCGFDPYNRR